MTEKALFFGVLLISGIYSVLSSSVNVSFTCDKNNNVVLPSNLTNFRLLLDDGNYCAPNSTQYLNCNVKNKKNIKVEYAHENDSKVVAGRNIKHLQLSCVDKKQDIKAVVGSFSVVTKPMEKYENLTVPIKQSVSMLILENMIKVTTPVTIGQKLQLKIIGPVNHTMSVTNCTATDGILTHDVWAQCDKYDEEIIGRKWNTTGSDDEIINDLYAFRFVHSTTVKIECYVNVCPHSDSSCKLQPNCQSSGKRRRRSSTDLETRQEAPDTHVASVSFDVKTEFDSANTAPGVYTAGIFKMLSIVVVLFLQV